MKQLTDNMHLPLKVLLIGMVSLIILNFSACAEDTNVSVTENIPREYLYSESYVISSNENPIANLFIMPYLSGAKNHEISIIYDPDPDNEIVNAVIQYDNGAQYPAESITHDDFGIYSVKFVDHSFPSTGLNDVTVDITYMDSSTESFTFELPIKGNIGLNFEYTNLNGYKVAVNVISNEYSDEDEYYWNFNDRSGELTGDSITHAYNRAGMYTITLSSKLSSNSISKKVPVIQTQEELDYLSSKYKIKDYSFNFPDDPNTEDGIIDWLLGLFGGN